MLNIYCIVHPVYIMCTSYICLMYILCTLYICPVYILCTCCLNPMYILFTSYICHTHTPYIFPLNILCISYVPSVYILSTSIIRVQAGKQTWLHILQTWIIHSWKPIEVLRFPVKLRSVYCCPKNRAVSWLIEAGIYFPP